MRPHRFLISILTFILLLSSCQFIPSRSPSAWQDPKSERWVDDAVFYQIFVRSFADSDGDGIGDFRGLTEKLDYLNDGDPETTSDLGVTGLWLMPIHPSPSYHGYDVTDYFAINPQYGTMEDFQSFLAAAHERGMRVIIDFVINHTSDQHPWFQAAASGDAQYRDYYLWAESKPGYKGPWGQDVWHASGEQFYYGVFVREMPDLNHGSPAVNAEIEKIARFWLEDIGIDGFRVDGAKHLIEEGQAQENTPATHAWFKQFNGLIKSIEPEAVLVGEIWSPSSESAPYVNDGELDLVFNFPLADDILAGATFRDGLRVGNSLTQQERAYDRGSYAPFLSNHDQTRSMTKMGGEFNRAKAAATMLLSAPGTPFLYYGEEIGMTGDKPDANIRTPMLWTGGAQAGFTSGTPWKAVNADYQLPDKNVESATENPDSLLNHYRQLIRVRSDHYALRSGQYVQVFTSDKALYATLRVAEQESVLVLANLSNEALSDYQIKWDEAPLQGTYKPSLLFGQGKAAPFTTKDDGSLEGFQPLPEIPANSSVIIQYRP